MKRSDFIRLASASIEYLFRIDCNYDISDRTNIILSEFESMGILPPFSKDRFNKSKDYSSQITAYHKWDKEE